MITILDCIKEDKPELKEAESISMFDAIDTGYPFFGGCCKCGASLAAYNMYPSKNGYVMCKGCIEGSEMGFNSFEEFVNYEFK